MNTLGHKRVVCGAKAQLSVLRWQQYLARVVVAVSNGLLEMVVRLLFRRTPDYQPKRILVFRSSGIGDFICCLPALSFLRRCFPASQIHLLSTATGMAKYRRRNFTPGAKILKHGQLVDNIILVDGQELTSLKGVVALRRRLRALAPDLTFVIPQTGEKLTSRLSKILFLYMLGARRNLSGYRMEKTLSILREAQYADGGFDHQVVSALKAVGGSAKDAVSFPIPRDAAVKQRVDQLWKEHGLQEANGVVALMPGSKFEHKRWPVENFSGLSERLAVEFGVSIVVLGGAQDLLLAQELCASCSVPLINLDGKTNLLETAEVLRRCRLYVGNDTGPAHIAAAVGTPCVTIFSSVVFPGIWEPWGKQNTVIRHRVPCEYCFSEDHCPRGTMECIKGITVEEVLAAVKVYLKDIGLPRDTSLNHGRCAPVLNRTRESGGCG